MKALRKDFFVELKKTYNKFLSLLLIVALGVAFYSGLRSTAPDMKISADKIYDNSNYMDIKVQSITGIRDDFIEKIEAIEGVEYVEGSYSYDAIDITLKDNAVVTLMSYSDVVNVPNIIQGKNIKSENECIIDDRYFNDQGYELGDVITIKSGTDIGVEYILKEKEYKIVGTFTSPLYLKNDRGSTGIGNGKISGAIYIDKSNYLMPVYTEAYVTVRDAKEELCFSDEYVGLVENVVEEIEGLEKDLYVIDRERQQQYVEFKMDSDRIGDVGDIVPLIFFAVAALVSLTTMIRMVEEQRTQIGTLKALGYGSVTISMKYIMYGMLATVFGCIVGGIVGATTIPYVIINAYKIIYQNLTIVETPINYLHFGVASGMAVVCVLGATVAACFKTLSSTAAELMRPAAPKGGKRIILERIPFIWNRMSFIWKSTIRNIVRYKKKMIMTIFGISGCTALLVIGFGIKDSINTIVDKQYGDLHIYNEVIAFDSGITDDGREFVYDELLEMKEVKGVFGMYQGGATFETANDKLEGYVYVPQNEKELSEYIKLKHKATGSEIEFEDDKVIITSKMAKLMKLSVGDEVKIKLMSGETATAVIGSIAENYVFHYIYMNDVTYEKLFGVKASATQVLINTEEEYRNADLAEEFLGIKGVGSTNSIDSLRGTFSEMLEGLDIIIVVIVAAAGGLAFVVLYNLNTINISERIRELATLKVLGFYDTEVSSYVFRENIILTIIGIVVGFFMGKGLHTTVINTVEPDMIMFGRDVFIQSYLYATLITIFFALIINFSMHYKLKKIDMSTSLKSVE